MRVTNGAALASDNVSWPDEQGRPRGRSRVVDLTLEWMRR